MADTGEHQAQVIIYLGGGGNRGAGVARGDLLLYGDSRRNAVDGIHIRLGHAPEELPCIRRQAFRKTSLPLGVKGIKHKGRFAGAGNSGHHDKLPSGYVQRQVLEIVDPGASDFYAVFH